METEISPKEQALAILQSEDLSLTNPLADSLKLDAASLFARANDQQNCIDTLELINAENLSNSQYIDYSFLLAETHLLLLNPQVALAHLAQPRFIALSNGFNKSTKQRQIELQSDLAFASGDPYQGLEGLVSLAKISKRKAQVRSVHNKIWQQISQLSYRQLAEGTDHKNIVVAGWLQLGLGLRQQQSNPALQADSYNEWKRRWRTHPAARVVPTAIGRYKRGGSPVDQLALLLPLQDQYKIPSYTLIEGFLEAYYSASSADAYQQYQAPEIRIYDTSQGSIQGIYNQAVAEGADVIIGPLRQSQVERLMSAPQLPVPTLTLNRVDASRLAQPKNLYQFGLSPRDELTQIADRAWRKGFRRVLLIAPDNSWGSRSAKFFHQHWTDKGGVVLQQVNYLSSTNDFTEHLKPSLQVDLSEQRGLQIKRFINSRVNYTVRRRQDIDLVVMLGYPQKARQIKPALDFLYASDVPVMATSHIYNGNQQEEFDRDLSGVEFSSMPWTLEGHLPYDLSVDEKLHTAYRHLYAVGHDAFLLHQNLQQLKTNDAPPLYGATGLLSLEDTVLVRKQKWAFFERGKVREIRY